MVNGSSKGENVKNVPKGTLAIVLNHLFLFMTQPMLGLEGGGGKNPDCCSSQVGMVCWVYAISICGSLMLTGRDVLSKLCKYPSLCKLMQRYLLDLPTDGPNAFPASVTFPSSLKQRKSKPNPLCCCHYI